MGIFSNSVMLVVVLIAGFVFSNTYASIRDGAYASIRDGKYTSIRGGFSFISELRYSKEDIVSDLINNKKGYSFSGAFGYKQNNYRIEIEAGMLGTDGKTLIDIFEGRNAIPAEVVGYQTDINITTVMMNTYYDFDNISIANITPYMGIGMGYAGITIMQTEDSSTYGISHMISKDNLFAYQGMAGISYFLQDNASIEVFYKYSRTSNPSLKKGIENIQLEPIQTSSVNIGLSYYYN